MSNGLERREFLKVLGVTGVGAGLTGCGTGGAEKLIPYVVPHEEVVPGVATWYRTTCRECPAGCGMDVRTREGRAVKAEGNPLSPISHGHLCARGQASLHGLYDPDRVPRPLGRAATGSDWDRLSWDEAERLLATQLQQNRGRTVFLTGNYTGTMDALLDEFAASVGAERVRWESFAMEPLRRASEMVYGVNAVPVHDFSQAEVYLSFGADFLETWLSPVDYQNGFAEGRAYSQGRRGKFISVGPHQSLTGLNCDEWLPARPGTEHLVALAIAKAIVDARGEAGPASLAGIDINDVANRAGIAPDRIRTVARDFDNGGRSLAAGPGISNQHNAATMVAAAVAILNQVAGNVGRTVRLDRREEWTAGTGTYAEVAQLVRRMENGEIGALLVHGPNPMYSLPDRDVVEAALAAVPFVASFSPYYDETSDHAHLLVPDHHFLESWGDYSPRTGITSLIQPVMTPVFQTKQTGDVLLSVSRRLNTSVGGGANTFYDYLRQRWAGSVYGAAGGAASFDDWWRETLQVGFVDTSGAGAGGAAAGTATQALPPMTLTEATFTGVDGNDNGTPGDDAFYLVVYPSYRFFDGRLANRPWLQELPDPVSKFTWSSWVEIHPDVADELRLDNGHIVEVETSHGSVRVPVWRHPGIRQDTIAIQLGQGHEQYGRYAKDRGVNALRLLQPAAEPLSGAFVYLQTLARVNPTGEWERPAMASLQNEQDNREIARSFTLGEARAADEERGFTLLPLGTPYSPPPGEYHPHHGHEPNIHPFDAHVESLQGAGGWQPAEVDASPQGFPQPGTHYGEYSEAQPRWAMSIDLERCTGCSACTTACYAENNIAMVGPEQIKMGRHLAWMRIERYFEGEGESLDTRFLPMLCQHCGTAPCEPVCPVYAAYHTPEGLNAQVYNRCVGTRYCANNCPYKVRVFNWYSAEWPEPLNWQLNPDVTVREKGVMEKCTMCVQRIRDAQNTARLDDRGVRDGEITPACAQTCPSEAIVFGNVKDPNSRVARIASSGRGYRVFEILNTQSAIVYLKRVNLYPTPADAHGEEPHDAAGEHEEGAPATTGAPAGQGGH